MGSTAKHSLFSSLPGTQIQDVQFLVQLSLFLWNYMGKFLSITQSCLCFLKKPVESMGSSEFWVNSRNVSMLPFCCCLAKDFQTLCMMQPLFCGVKIISFSWCLSGRKTLGACCSCWIFQLCIFYPTPQWRQKTKLHLTKCSASWWEKRKQNMPGQHQSQNYGSCQEQIKVQGYKLPRKSPYWIWTEKLILGFNLGLPPSAAFCCLFLHLKMKRKP